MAVGAYRPVLADFMPLPAPILPPLGKAAGTRLCAIDNERADDTIEFSDYLAQRNLEAPDAGPEEPSRDLARVPRAERQGLTVDEIWLNVRSRDSLVEDDYPASPNPIPGIGTVSPVDPGAPTERPGPIARILLIPGAIGRFIDLFM